MAIAQLRDVILKAESKAADKNISVDFSQAKAELDKAAALAVSGKKYAEGEFERAWSSIKSAAELIKNSVKGAKKQSRDEKRPRKRLREKPRKQRRLQSERPKKQRKITEGHRMQNQHLKILKREASEDEKSHDHWIDCRHRGDDLARWMRQENARAACSD